MAEPGKVYGYSGKFCHCGWAASQGPINPGPVEALKDYDEFKKQLVQQQKNNYRSSVDTIIGLCSNMTQEQLKAVAALISTLYDCRASDD